MDLYKLLIATFLAFAIVNFAVIPEMKRRWNANRSLAKISKAGALAALSFARTFLLIAAITCLGLLLITLLLGLGGAATTTQLRAASMRIQGYRDAISIIQRYSVGWISFFLLVGLTILAYRREKRHLREQFERRIQEETERLQREAEKGEWANLPPTPEMREIVLEIQRAQIAYDGLPGNSRADEKTKTEKQAVHDYIRMLRSLWHTRDIERRINVSWDNESPKAEPNARSRVASLLTSKGFLGTMKAASRSLTNAGTVLMVLSLIGINATTLDETLRVQQVHWNDLKVEANQRDVKDSFDRLMAQTQSKKEEDKDEKKDEHREQENKNVLNYLARSFERSLSKSDIWRSVQNPGNVDQQVRRSVVKQQILAEVRNSTSEAYAGAWHHDVNSSQGDYESRGTTPSEETIAPAGRRGGYSSAENRATAAEQTRSRSTSSLDEAAATRERGSTKSGGAQMNASVPEPQTSVGKKFRRDLEETLRERTGLFERIKTKFYAQIDQYSQAAEITDISNYAFSEMVGSFIDGATGSSDTEMGKLVSKIAKAAIKDSGKDLYELLFKRMINDLASDTEMRDAFKRVSDLESGDYRILRTSDITRFRETAATVVKSSEYSTYLKDHPPSLADNPNDIAELRKLAERFKATYKGGSAVSSKEVNAFASYDDIYQSQKRTEKTVRESLLAELQTNGSKGREIADDISQADFMRSRTYGSLLGHPDTGGVLIGQSPLETAKDANFIDIQWNINDREVWLILKRADGKAFQLGPYKLALVHQALAYVADGRKDAVTILNVDYRGHQKVFLHPAFIDTQLGRNIIQLDQFIFDVMEKDPRYIDAEQRIDAQSALYTIAWFDRILADSEHQLKFAESKLEEARNQESSKWSFPTLPGLRSRPQYDIQKLETYRKECKDRINLLRTDIARVARRKLASEASRRPEELRNVAHSILARKPEFFDPDLVEKTEKCALHNRDSMSGFDECIRSSVDTEVASADEQTINNWYIPPPSIESLSGVRERPFKIDADLSFLARESSDGPAAQLWPLDYTILRAFSSQPGFLPAGQNSDQYIDKSPWEFEELKAPIADKVWNKINSDPRLKASYDELREFTVLQRLFRVALESEAWKEFPIEKLVALTEATSLSYRYTPTERWENHLRGSLRPDIFERLSSNAMR